MAKLSLAEKLDFYVKLSKSHQDKEGFIMADECDSLLFTSLYGTVPGTEVNITAARSSEGQWFRRPTYLPECLSCGGSNSTISRDMFWGLLWYCWANKRLDILEDLFAYGRKHSWIMGKGQIGTLLFMPFLQGLLAEMIFKLGGKNHRFYRTLKHLPTFSTITNRGFTVHLDFLAITLMAEVDPAYAENLKKDLLKQENSLVCWLKGKYQKLIQRLASKFSPTIQPGIDALAFYSPADIVRYHATRQPENALYSYVLHKHTDGDFTDTIKVLMDARYFPENHLPEDKNRASDYLWQREMGPDWAPKRNSSGVEYTGCDFIWLANLVLKNQKT